MKTFWSSNTFNNDRFFPAIPAFRCWVTMNSRRGPKRAYGHTPLRNSRIPGCATPDS